MWWWQTKISEGVRQLAQQIVERPEDWRQGPYCFSNIKHRDINIWTANGVSFIKFEGNECLNLAEKRHISSAINKAIARRLANPS